MLRSALPIVAATLLFAACDRGPTESRPSVMPSLEAMLVTAGEGASAVGFLDRAPSGLQLTAAQRAAIRTINEQFRTANQADLDALMVITRDALTAQRAGGSHDALRTILEKSRPIRERLMPAFMQLAQSLNAVLTDAQRAWLRENAQRLGPQLPTLPPRQR